MKKLMNAILVSMVCVLSMSFSLSTIKASEEDEYVEIQQGNEEEQKENEFNLSTNLQNAENMEKGIQPRGWGDVVRPSVVEVKQANGYYCGPASVFMTLTQINGSSPSQATLASSMGTTSSNGTYVYKVTNELNARQSKFTYAYQQISDKSALKKALYTSIGYNAPAILHVLTGSLAMYNGNSFGHYVVGTTVVEYNSNGVFDAVGYVDPWYADYGKGSVYGLHIDTADNVFRAVQNRYVIWGTKK